MGQTGLVRLGENLAMRPCAAASSLFLSPRWSRITSLRMKVSCKQQCNVAEQTPSRHRVAAHFCSIYQSKADSEIYEGNKGGCWTQASDGCRRKRNIHYIIFKLKPQAAKVAGEWKNVFQPANPEILRDLWGEEQLAERLTVMEDCLIARLIGQHIKRSVHFPVRIHPTGYFLLPDVEKLPSSEVVRINTVILNAVFLPGQPGSRRAELLVDQKQVSTPPLRRIEWLLVDQKQVSNIFMLNLHQQHTFFPSLPQLKLGFTLLSNELKLRAVSPFNSPTPSSHYSPNYRHPIQRISCSSWHVRSIIPVLSLSSTTKRWRSDERSILPDSEFNGSSKALKRNFLAELTGWAEG